MTTIPPCWVKMVKDSSEMSRMSIYANIWQALDVKSTPREEDALNTGAQAIILLSHSIANT